MKFLCVCQKGCNRSVFMVYRLKRHGHSAIPVGWMTESPETLAMLSSWADKIIVMEADFKAKIPIAQQHKVLIADVGRDVWGPRWHPELKQRVYDLFDGLGLGGLK